MLQIISLIFIVGIFGWLFYAFRNELDNLTNTWNWFQETGKQFSAEIKNSRPRTLLNIWEVLKKHIYFLGIITFIVLAVTGLVPFLFFDRPMPGFVLLLHVALSPIFSIFMVQAAIRWAHLNRFEIHPRQKPKQHFFHFLSKKQNESHRKVFLEKLFFWLIIIFATLSMTIIFSMYPIFGSEGQHFLLQFHKLNAVFLTVAVLAHASYLIRVRAKEREVK